MIVFSGDPTSNFAARLMTEASWRHFEEQNFFGLMLKPAGLKRFRQIGLVQTISDSAENGLSTVCTLDKIDAAVLAWLIGCPRIESFVFGVLL